MDSDELEARKDEIEEELEEEDDDRKIVALLRELTLIEQILGAVAGAILLDNIIDDDSRDTVAPVITLNGSNPDSVELGDTYVDPGADADTGETVVVSGSVDTSTVGSYTLTYTATDASGNVGTATRTVNVVDTTPPAITVLGDNPATLELGDTYVDSNATAEDASGTATITASDNIDPDVIGTYTVTYTATDASGNSSTATRTVNVVDTTSPTITISGDNPVTVEFGDSYSDAGASAEEADETVPLETTSNVDTDTVGSYSVTYTATDGSGNTATASRTVNVVDTTAPVFVSTGNFTMDENSTGPIGTLSATDLGNLTYSMGDGGSVIEVTEGGVLSFSSNAFEDEDGNRNGIPDYEGSGTYPFDGDYATAIGCSGNNDDNYVVNVSDGYNSASLNLCVQINNLNDNDPEITSGASFSAEENQTAIGTATASDADGDLNDLTFSISGSELAIGELSGVLTFVTAPDYETQTSYTATVTVSDGTKSK
jgi:hypothetical protein